MMNEKKTGLRLFSLLGIWTLGISMILFFGYFTYQSFSEGIQVGLWLTMSELAKVEGVSAGNPVSILDFSIASTWQDTPSDIQTQFSLATMQLNDVEMIATRKNVFALPSEVYIVYLLANEAGQPRFITYSIVVNGSGVSNLLRLLIVVIIAIIIFSSLVMATLFYKRRSITRLRDWAKSLSTHSLLQQLPDFSYDELNALAKIIHSSVNSVRKSVDREQLFLRNASHELRTPIAVINSNLALLEKMKQANKSELQQQVVLDRIIRANSSMLHITETLLWLSREDDRSVSYTVLRLDSLVESVINSLEYLLQCKQVRVERELLHCELKLPAGGCYIVVANLIRNAFQHTDNGVVTIKQGANFISVRNVNFNVGSRQYEQSISFGLGVKLIKNLSKRFDWKYRHVIEQNGYYVEVHF